MRNGLDDLATSRSVSLYFLYFLMSLTKGQIPRHIFRTPYVLLSGKEHHMGAATQLSDFNNRELIAQLIACSW